MSTAYLLETCLLSHGLRSVSADDLRRAFAGAEHPLGWVEDGVIRIGGIEEFLPFRESKKSSFRINARNMAETLEQKGSGALTASGAMEVCRREGIPLAVTCGMGGFRPEREERASVDLEAVVTLPVTLIATAPKDMLDIPRTLNWFKDRGVELLGAGTDRMTGYVFKSADEPITGCEPGSITERIKGSSAGRIDRPGTDGPEDARQLVFLPIPEEKRIADRSILDEAVKRGLASEEAGGYFHPAVNAALDELTDGYASRIQLDSFVKNAGFAAALSAEVQ